MFASFTKKLEAGNTYVFGDRTGKEGGEKVNRSTETLTMLKNWIKLSYVLAKPSGALQFARRTFPSAI
jgi:hypothetical protein